MLLSWDSVEPFSPKLAHPWKLIWSSSMCLCGPMICMQLFIQMLAVPSVDWKVLLRRNWSITCLFLFIYLQRGPDVFVVIRKNLPLILSYLTLAAWRSKRQTPKLHILSKWLYFCRGPWNIVHNSCFFWPSCSFNAPRWRCDPVTPHVSFHCEELLSPLHTGVPLKALKGISGMNKKICISGFLIVWGPINTAAVVLRLCVK